MAYYTVKKGDTLSEIARQNGTTYQEIAKQNNISNPNLIYPGQQLKIGNDDNAAATAPETPAVSQPDAPKAEQNTYTPSETVMQAEALLQQQNEQKPGDYKSTWEGQLKDTIAQILNREKFSYDVNEDPLYQQLREQYIQQGSLAMMDTMGQAAALTGGHGNSYALSAGQQAYQAYLQGLNERVPELYGMALDKYTQEGQALYDQASLLSGMEEQEYGRYMDRLSNYYTELGLARDEARYQAELDYGKYRDSLEDARYDTQYKDSQRNEAYNKLTSLISLGYKPTDAELAAAGLTRAQADAIASGVSSGSSGGSNARYTRDVTEEETPEPFVWDPNDISLDIWTGVFRASTLDELSTYLDGLIGKGEISEEQALKMMARWEDDKLHAEALDGFYA